MTAAATAAAALSMAGRTSAQRETRERLRDLAARTELEYRARLVADIVLWGKFPVMMRPFWLAQRAKCGYCGNRIELSRNSAKKAAATWDHVVPSSAGGRGHADKNKVIAHGPCNNRKGDRLPYACEILFCQITNEIVEAMRGAK